MLIGIAGAVYLTIGGLAGAVCFSGGLMLICLLKLLLYTGKAGYVGKEVSPKNLLIILIFNLIGAYLIGKLFVTFTSNSDLIAAAQKITAARVANIWWKNIIGGFICGFMIYCGVHAFKETQNSLAIIACVVFFIIVGSYHSIADMFYYSVSGLHNWYLAEICIIIGNFMGCIFLPFISQLNNKKPD